MSVPLSDYLILDTNKAKLTAFCMLKQVGQVQWHSSGFT